jgi:hypothetical protein
MYLEVPLAFDDTSQGDSGSLYFAADPDNPEYHYALGSHSGRAQIDSDSLERDVLNFGPQGFTLDDLYDRRWDN